MIDSIEDESSSEARSCRRHYDARRRLMLELLDWNFARRRFWPTVLPGEPTPVNLPVACQLPQGALRIRRVETAGKPVMFKREEHVYIPAREADTQIIATVDQSNATAFPPIFTQALEFALAAAFVMEFGRSVNRSREYRQMMRDALEEADMIEGQERSDDDAFDGGRIDELMARLV